MESITKLLDWMGQHVKELVFIYIVIGIVTFGKAQAEVNASYQNCLIRVKESEQYRCRDFPIGTIASIAGSMVWPLYWSYKIFK